MLIRRLLAMEVLGRCGLGLAEGLSPAVGVPGTPGEESMPTLCLLEDAVLGGVISLTLTQSVEVRRDETDG